MLVCALVAFCTDARGMATRAMVRSQDAPQLEPVEFLRLGEENGDTPVFGRISALAVGEDGSIAVGDAQDRRISVFSQDGTLQLGMGGPGAGPGEFSQISGLYFGEKDSLYVYDSFDLERLTVYEPDQFELAYTARIQRTDSAFAAELLGVTRESLIFRYEHTRASRTEDERRFSVVRRVNWAGQAVADPILMVEAFEIAVTVLAHGLRSESLPFGRSSTIRMGPDHTLYWGWTGDSHISVMGLDGTLTRQVLHQQPRRRVTGSDRRAALERVSGGLRDRLTIRQLHDTWPAYETFAVDEQSRVWLRPIGNGGEDSVAWNILDARGESVGTAVLPAHFDLRAFRSGRLYGISPDEAGAPIIVGYEIPE